MGKRARAWVEPNPKHPRSSKTGRFVRRGTGAATKVVEAVKTAAGKAEKATGGGKGPAKSTPEKTAPKKGVSLARIGPRPAPKALPKKAEPKPVNPNTGRRVARVAPASSEYRAIGTAEAAAMQRRMLDGRPWTAAQTGALRRYTGPDFAGMNGHLRTGRGGSAADRAAITHARAAMRETTEDVIVSRRVQANAFGFTGRDLTDAQVRQLTGRGTFHDPGFTSASVGANHTGLSMRISVPRGTRAAYVNDVSVNRGENEIILDAGTHYRIDRIERHLLKGTIVHVTVVGQDD